MTSQYITYEDYNMTVSERKLAHNTLCTNRLFGGVNFLRIYHVESSTNNGVSLHELFRAVCVGLRHYLYVRLFKKTK